MTLRARSHLHFHVATLTAAALAMALGAIPRDAEGRPGGGGRGAATSVHRGGGGGMAARPAAGSRSGGGGGARPAAGSRPGGGGGISNSGNRGGNTVNRGGNRVNDGNINIGNDVNIDVDRGWDNNGWDHHPVAAGVAFGTAAAVTSAVVGSMIYTLPPACSSVYYGGISYSQCGNAWYAPQYAGSSVTYVVVNPPY